MENAQSKEAKILRIQCRDDVNETTPIAKRKYTLTFSKSIPELNLTIGLDYFNKDDSDAIRAEWKPLESSYSLNLYCNVGNKWPESFACIRYEVFVTVIPCILQAIKYSEKELFEQNPDLNYAPIYVSFKSSYMEFNQQEYWNRPCDYEIIEFVKLE